MSRRSLLNPFQPASDTMVLPSLYMLLRPRSDTHCDYKFHVDSFSTYKWYSPQFYFPCRFLSNLQVILTTVLQSIKSIGTVVMLITLFMCILWVCVTALFAKLPLSVCLLLLWHDKSNACCIYSRCCWLNTVLVLALEPVICLFLFNFNFSLMSFVAKSSNNVFSHALPVAGSIFHSTPLCLSVAADITDSAAVPLPSKRYIGDL